MKRIMLLFIIGLLMSGCSGTIEKVVDIPEAEDIPSEKVVISIEEEVNQGIVQVEEDEISEEAQVMPLVKPLIFSVTTIDEAMAASMMGRSFHENDHIQMEDLRYVQTGYVGFDGESHQGAIVVNAAIAQTVLEVFMDLYDAKYPIESMIPIDAFDGSDHASMVANNSSGFNYRVISGTDRLSNHAYGLAIDINPLVNPWVSSNGSVDPEEGAAYADRSLVQQGMIHKGDLCYSAFVSRGFTWGGEWNNSKDYQHFDIEVEGIQ